METDPKITQMLELVNRDFKITIISCLKDLVEKVNNTYKQIGNLGREYTVYLFIYLFYFYLHLFSVAFIPSP